MNTRIKHTAFVLFFCFTALKVHAQGCSDAGFCTINSVKPSTSDSNAQFKNEIKIAGFIGGADHSISVRGAYLDYSRRLNNKFGFDIRVTTLGQSGNGITTFGFSDVFVNGNYRIRNNIKLNIGAKLPLNDANKSLNYVGLPMDYQSSLGTTDLILGLGFSLRSFQIAAALQQPLTQNKNAFLASNYPESSPISSIQSTRNFVRSGDALLRVSYPIKLAPKFTCTPGVLSIYHLAEDKYMDEVNEVKTIAGSDGLTINGTVFFDYKINHKHALQLNAGMPFVVRKSRPDGLTRGFITNLEYRFAF